METNNKYAGQTVLLTGATSGIGNALGKLFAKDGWNMVIVGRFEETLNQWAQDFKILGAPRVDTIVKDLFVPGAAKEVYDETVSRGITINALVNDAGQGQRGKLTEYDLQRDVDVVNLNITSLVTLTKCFLKDMLARNEGRILNLASEVSVNPSPMLAVYAATKAFVLSFTDAIIHEVKDTNVTLTALLPTATDTDFFRKADAEGVVATTHMSPADEVALKGYEGMLNGSHRAYANFTAWSHAVMGMLLPNEVITTNTEKEMLMAEQH